MNGIVLLVVRMVILLTPLMLKMMVVPMEIILVLLHLVMFLRDIMDMRGFLISIVVVVDVI